LQTPQTDPITDARKRSNVRVIGKGQPIVFAHGYGCDQNMWRHIVPAFEKDYQIVLFDHVGAGNSDPRAFNSTRHSSLQGYADDVLDICSALDLKNVIFVGHSVSAMIGVLAAIKEPARFAKLVLIGPSPCYINSENYTGGFSKEDIEGLLVSLDSNYLGWSQTMAPVIMGRPDRPELGEELSNSFCRMDPKIAKHFARVTFLSDNRHDLSRLEIPSLILQCSNDIIAPTEVGHYLHKNLSGSHFVQMKASGHCPNLSAPEETIAEIKAFI
jgi:sigma-B regulation protein RsbQ